MCWGEERPFTSFRLRSVLAAGAEEKRRDGSGKGWRASVKSHCDYECNCSSGAQGPCSSDGARRCFMHSNTEEESEKERKSESGRERQAAKMFAPLFFSKIASSISFLLPSFPPFFSLPAPPKSSFIPLLFSSLLLSPLSCPPPLAGLAGSR